MALKAPGTDSFSLQEQREAVAEVRDLKESVGKENVIEEAG